MKANHTANHTANFVDLDIEHGAVETSDADSGVSEPTNPAEQNKQFRDPLVEQKDGTPNQEKWDTRDTITCFTCCGLYFFFMLGLTTLCALWR